jgi:hypothetical protein
LERECILVMTSVIKIRQGHEQYHLVPLPVQYSTFHSSGRPLRFGPCLPKALQQLMPDIVRCRADLRRTQSGHMYHIKTEI